MGCTPLLTLPVLPYMYLHAVTLFSHLRAKFNHRHGISAPSLRQA